MDIVMYILCLRWDPTNAFFICGVVVLFSNINLYLFLKCITSNLKPLTSLCFEMGSICYLLYNNIHS